MAEDLLKHFDPFIGCLGPGDSLPGPYLPHGIVRPGPDTVPPHRTKGYGHHDLKCEDPLRIKHFSQNHIGGTGGGGRYGNIGIYPFCGKLRTAFGGSRIDAEEASAGYYGVTLQPEGIRAEVTCTRQVGVYRFSFPEGAQAGLLIDAGAVITTSREMLHGAELGRAIGGYVEWAGPAEIVGRADLQGGWGHERPYSVYFCIRTDHPIQDWYGAVGDTMFKDRTAVGAGAKGILGLGAIRELNVHAAISYVSIGQARAAIEAETKGRTFQQVHASAISIWEKTLAALTVTGGTHDQRTVFYTSLARLRCLPTDLGVDDENWLWKSGIRHLMDFYCLWDSVRNANSFLMLIDPDFSRDILNCFLDIADHTGWFPDAWIAGHSARNQGGSSADVLFAEAALKKIEGIDYEKALKQMRKHLEVQAEDPLRNGRYLAGYNSVGYVTPDEALNCVSRSLEYTFQDWSIGALARELGDEELAAACFESAAKCWILWNEKTKVFAPKKASGDWIDPFDPDIPVRPDTWNDPYYYEASARDWTMCLMQDIAGLIEHFGGEGPFMEMLDAYFSDPNRRWKETLLHTPYLYHYAGRPDTGSRQAREILAADYHTGRDGLPDNEDMGSQSTFIMCVSMGLYPMMGQDLYLLSAPLFEETIINTGKGKLTIKAPGADSEKHYVTGARLNGKALDRMWVQHHELEGDAVIEMDVSEEPDISWVRKVPPSPMQSI